MPGFIALKAAVTASVSPVGGVPCSAPLETRTLRPLRPRRSPGVGLCGFFQSLADVGGEVGGLLQAVDVQQGADGLDAAALLAHDGGVQGRVESKAVCLCLHIARSLVNSASYSSGVFCRRLGEAVLRGLELGLCVFELGLELFGDGLLAVDVSAVFRSSASSAVHR